jgi:hypothetical protein
MAVSSALLLVIIVIFMLLTVFLIAFAAMYAVGDSRGSSLNLLVNRPREQAMMDMIKDRPTQKRGISIVAGGRRVGKMALGLVVRIRSLGCELPIEICYLGIQEFRDVEPMVELSKMKDVSCLNLKNHDHFVQPENVNDAKRSKILAIAVSNFETVLLLDSDTIPLINLDSLFDFADRDKKNHAILWPKNVHLDGSVVYNPVKFGAKKRLLSFDTDSGVMLMKKCDFVKFAIAKILELNSYKNHKKTFQVMNFNNTFSLVLDQLQVPHKKVDSSYKNGTASVQHHPSDVKHLVVARPMSRRFSRFEDIKNLDLIVDGKTVTRKIPMKEFIV